MTELSLHLRASGVALVLLGVAHVLMPTVLVWSREMAGASRLNREISYVHCFFIALSCLLWGLLALGAGAQLTQPNPITRMVLIGAVAFWGSRFVIQLAVFNRHARRSRRWCALSLVGTGLWLYLTLVWAWALHTQL